MESQYTPKFYDDLADGSRQSADIIVPRVLGEVSAKTVVDVGCGIGTWAAAFARAGCNVLGIDGDYVNRQMLQIPPDRFVARNLEQPITGLATFDLAVSLEVAEHLSAARAAGFVSELAGLAPCILFSAAIPCQDGTDHRNEQWLSYWVDLFRVCGCQPLDWLRPQIWDDDRICWWYRQNIILFCKTDQLAKYAHLDRGKPMDLVHPQFVAAHGSDRSPLGLRQIVQSIPGALMRSMRNRFSMPAPLVKSDSSSVAARGGNTRDSR